MKDDFLKCIFCDAKLTSEIGRFILDGKLMFRVDCKECNVHFFLDKENLSYYIINIDSDFGRYMMLCEIGPEISCIYHNGSVVLKNIPDIYNPKEANSKLKTLLVFS